MVMRRKPPHLHLLAAASEPGAGVKGGVQKLMCVRRMDPATFPNWGTNNSVMG